MFEGLGIGQVMLAPIGGKDVFVDILWQKGQAVVGEQLAVEGDGSGKLGLLFGLPGAGGKVVDIEKVEPPEVVEIEAVIIIAVALDKGRGASGGEIWFQDMAQVVEGDVQIAGGHLERDVGPEQGAELFHGKEVTWIEKEPFEQALGLIASPLWFSQGLLIKEDAKGAKEGGFVASGGLGWMMILWLQEGV